MGFLQTSDDLVSNVNKATANILDSKFTQYISGNGSPVLVDYYNLDEIMSTANRGYENLDDLIGKDSPLRYNHIKNFPIYGLKEVLPEKDEVDMGLLDMNMETELIILPNTIKPHEHDYIFYTIPGANATLTFRVDNFEFTTIKSNSYYRINVSLQDINSTEYRDKLDRQVVSNKTAVLDNIGSQEKCIIDDDKLEDIERLKKILSYIMEQYVDTFWDKKYNSFIHKDESSRYLGYDPYLTEFLKRHNLIDLQDSVFISLINFDQRNECRIAYNKSIYRNLELQDISKLHTLLKVPTNFTTVCTNPFYYYGEDTAFSLDLLVDYIENRGKDNKLYYIDIELIDRIRNNQPLMLNEPIRNTYSSDNTRIFWNLIITYLNKSGCYNLLDDSNVGMEDILGINIDYSHESYLYTPIVVYILTEYVKELTNGK